MKLRSYCGMNDTSSVAPFTGAWIETGSMAKRLRLRIVAPFTGAWIETPQIQ